jgi:hypothetical protein
MKHKVNFDAYWRSESTINKHMINLGQVLNAFETSTTYGHKLLIWNGGF